jgi:hypothetical protein
MKDFGSLGTVGHSVGMASIYKRKGSGFYWVKYRDPATGELARKSTGIVIDRPDGGRLAKRKEAEYTQKEMSAPKSRESERWEVWADAFLAHRYENPHTLINARKGLRDVLAFCKHHGIRTPRQLTYTQAAEFVRWRTDPNGVLPAVSINTARLRFVFLNLLMSEAVKRGYVTGNPCREVRNQRIAPREKQEITAHNQRLIETALKKKPQWMQDQWLVLMRQGCRVAETAVPMKGDRINTEAMTITLKIKGGRLHTQALHPDLIPLIARAKSENRLTLVQGPPVSSWSPIWSDFFSRRELPYSIHCTRVTVITRLLRAGHSPALVCAFIGHSEEVNRIYRRLKPPDSLPLLNTLASPSIPAGGNRKPRSPRGRKARPARA